MKLIVGLGNPGKEYDLTRHNCGYIFVSDIAEKLGLTLKENKDLNCYITETTINSEKVILIQPTTYMNLSGEAVLKVCKYYKIATDDILVISDDMDLPVGSYKIKPFGGTGGHKGLKSIIELFGTEDIKRIRIGIGKPVNKTVVDFVLEKFSKSEIEQLQNILQYSSDMVTDLVNLKFDNFMNKYNSLK